MGETVPMQWYKERAEQGTCALADEATTSAPQEVPKYPKAAPIMQAMGFSGTVGLGKEGQGITEPIEVKERPMGLGLGADLDAPVVIKPDLQSTFTPPPLVPRQSLQGRRGFNRGGSDLSLMSCAWFRAHNLSFSSGSSC